MDEKALQKSMGCLKTANKFRTETVFDESAKGDNPETIEEKEGKIKSDKVSDMNSDKDSEMISENSESESDIEEKRLKNNIEAKKLFQARKDLKLPLNDYERKRALNIRDMAEEKKKFKDDLKASKQALKQALKRKPQAPRPLLKCEFCERPYKSLQPLETHKRLKHKHKLKNIKSEVYSRPSRRALPPKRLANQMFEEYDSHVTKRGGYMLNGKKRFGSVVYGPC